MDFVMTTYPGKPHRDWWAKASTEEKRAEIVKVEAWFREHAALGRIQGGAEMGDPSTAKTIRRGVVTDGPFLETKELLGGFILIKAPDWETALEIAGGWPSLAWEDDAVEIRPEGETSSSD
jgi:hypothetical protein